MPVQSPSPPGTPPAFALPAATWGSRAGAQLLDGVVMFLLSVLVALITYLIAGDRAILDVTTDVNGVTQRDSLPYWAVAGGVGFLLIALTYPWLMLGLLRGRTPGRRLVGIRIVNYDGSPLRLGQAFMREGVVKGALWFFALPLLLSYLWPLWDPHQRALHDLIMSTRVVREDGKDGGPAADAFGSASAAPPTAAPRSDPDDLAGRIGLGG